MNQQIFHNIPNEEINLAELVKETTMKEDIMERFKPWLLSQGIPNQQEQIPARDTGRKNKLQWMQKESTCGNVAMRM